MQQQASELPFGGRGVYRAPKEIADTSRESYRELQPSVEDRERAVLRGLAAFYLTLGETPTAYELLRFMQAADQAFDLNSVRPRLTEMAKQERRLVEKQEKRACRVTGKRVFTWRATARGILYANKTKALNGGGSHGD